jgi:hypothetical protein
MVTNDAGYVVFVYVIKNMLITIEADILIAKPKRSIQSTESTPQYKNMNTNSREVLPMN